MVSLRIDAETKERLICEAARLDYPSLAAMALDRILDTGGSAEVGTRESLILCGRLGLIGGLVNELIDSEGQRAPDLAAALATISGEIVSLQRDILARQPC